MRRLDGSCWVLISVGAASVGCGCSGGCAEGEVAVEVDVSTSAANPHDDKVDSDQ